MNHAVEQLKTFGAEVVDPVEIPSTNNKWKYDVLTYEFKADLNGYLRGLAPHIKVKSLADVIAFNRENSEAALKYGQTILEEAEKTSGTLTEEAYISSLEEDVYFSTEQGIDHVLKEHNLDAIVTPNNFGAGIPAKAGYPSITVPAGYSLENEPVGITFTGKAFSEAGLISIAYAFEQGTKVRKSPLL
jgi:amidase